MSTARRVAACSLLPLLFFACTSEPGSGVSGAGTGGVTGGQSTGGGSSVGAGGASATGVGGAGIGGAATGAGGSALNGGSAGVGGTPGGAGGASGGTAGTTGGVGGVGGGGTGGTSGSGGSGGSGGTTETTTFTNPLNSSHGSNPWMTYYDGFYYLAATTWGDTLTMKKGQTIEELKDATPEVIWEDANAARCCNMWAPEFYLINGPNGNRWYHYYTAGDGDDLGTQRQHVLESEGTDPMGPYHYQGQLLTYWAIDGSILEVGASRYLMFSAWDGPTQNAWIIAMTNPWTVTGNRTLLTAPTYAWEQEGSDSVNEGPVALYHGGRTFVTYSASQCADPGYKMGLLELTGQNPLSAQSWTKSATPVFQAANNAYGPAHNGFFVSPDGTENWLVYHATTNSNGSCWTDRTTRIQPFTWNGDGTPNFGEPLATSEDIIVPSGSID